MANHPNHKDVRNHLRYESPQSGLPDCSQPHVRQLDVIRSTIRGLTVEACDQISKMKKFIAFRGTQSIPHLLYPQNHKSQSYPKSRIIRIDTNNCDRKTSFFHINRTSRRTRQDRILIRTITIHTDGNVGTYGHSANTFELE